MLHLDTCFLNLRICLLQTLQQQRCPKWPLNPQKQPALRYLRELVNIEPESKKTAWRQATQREKGVSPQRDGNRKPEGFAFEHSICITLLNAVQKELVLVSYNRKACLRPWCNKCSNERCWWTISNFREMPKSKKTPFTAMPVASVCCT